MGALLCMCDSGAILSQFAQPASSESIKVAAPEILKYEDDLKSKTSF